MVAFGVTLSLAGGAKRSESSTTIWAEVTARARSVAASIAPATGHASAVSGSLRNSSAKRCRPAWTGIGTSASRPALTRAGRSASAYGKAPAGVRLTVWLSRSLARWAASDS
jgi:hypothetical protein